MKYITFPTAKLNEMWGLKVNTLNQMYAHRDTDVAEKFALWKSQVDGDFGLYKSQVDGDFGLYKSIRDLYDNQTEKLNNAAFGLYKNQRDGFDVLNARISCLEKEVAVGAAIRPYQDKLIQCEIERAFTAGINYVDKKTCNVIYGVTCLPNEPTTTGLVGRNANGCLPCGFTQTASTPAT